MNTLFLANELQVSTFEANGQLRYSKAIVGLADKQRARVTSILEVGGGLLLGGGYDTNGPAEEAGFLLRLDANGRVLWLRHYRTDTLPQGPGFIHSVAPSPDGGFLAIGGGVAKNGRHGVAAMKVDSTGQILWERTYLASSPARGVAVSAHADGYYLLASMSTGPGAISPWFLDVDPAGFPRKNGLFQVDLMGVSEPALTSCDGFIITAHGTLVGFGGRLGDGAVPYVFEIESDLKSVRWASIYAYPGALLPRLVSIAALPDGLLLAGHTTPREPKNAFGWIAQTDQNGTVPGCDVIRPIRMYSVGALLTESVYPSSEVVPGLVHVEDRQLEFVPVSIQGSTRCGE